MGIKGDRVVIKGKRIILLYGNVGMQKQTCCIQAQYNYPDQDDWNDL
jgi:hypothetical protein